MNSVIKWSLILVAAVTILNIGIQVTGLHENPIGGLAFVALAIVFNITAVVLALRETRAGNSYGKQLLNGLLIGLVAGILIFVTSWLAFSVVFPNSIQEMIDGNIAFLESAPLDEAMKQQQIVSLKAMTAVSQATSGLMGTFFTSILVAAIAGAFLRKK